MGENKFYRNETNGIIPDSIQVQSYCDICDMSIEARVQLAAGQILVGYRIQGFVTELESDIIGPYKIILHLDDIFNPCSHKAVLNKGFLENHKKTAHPHKLNKTAPPQKN